MTKEKWLRVSNAKQLSDNSLKRRKAMITRKEVNEYCEAARENVVISVAEITHHSTAQAISGPDKTLTKKQCIQSEEAWSKCPVSVLA